MRSGAMIIAAKEQEYVRRLADYMRDCSEAADWQVTAFTHPQALKQYLRSGYPADLIAAQPAFLEEAGDALPEGVPVVLLARKLDGTGKYPQVMQFQSLPKLIHELNGIYHGANGLPALAGGNESDPVTVAIYSAAGGIGKTTLALNLVRQAAEEGKRVFYLNLELWNGTSLYYGSGSDTDDGLPDMLYTLQSQPERAEEQFVSLRKRHPLMKSDYFAPLPAPEERLALTPELVLRFHDLVRRKGGYDLIIVDLDCAMDAVHLQVLECCSLMLWLGSPDPSGTHKGTIALEYARQKWGDVYISLERKIKFVQVGEPDPEKDRQILNTLKEKTVKPVFHGILPFIPQWRYSRHPSELLASPVYRGAVRWMLEQWIWPKGGGGRNERGGGFGAQGTYPGSYRPERIGIG